MTEYLTNYMKYVQQRLEKCSSAAELDEIMAEHKDKIAFMQHERIVHFLVTMLFALVLTVFMAVILFKPNLCHNSGNYDTCCSRILHQALLLPRKYGAEDVQSI